MRTRPSQRTPAQGRGRAVCRAVRANPWASCRTALWPGRPNQGPCLCAAAPGCLGRFVEHLVCGGGRKGLNLWSPRSSGVESGLLGEKQT
jgi:hypothetical protein